MSSHPRLRLLGLAVLATAVLIGAGEYFRIHPRTPVLTRAAPDLGTVTVSFVPQPAPRLPVPVVSIRSAPALPEVIVNVPEPVHPEVEAEVQAHPDATALREDVPVSLSQSTMFHSRVAILRGGQPVSRHVLWRSSVVEFIKQAGAVAGVNGTFFKDAAIASNDSNMLGPMLTPDGHFLSETDPVQLKKIGGRPFVAWSHDTFLATDFVPGSMNHRAQVAAMLPGITDAFVAGSWLVRGGQALTLAQMSVHAPKDAQEIRPRVFFGVTRDGLIIAGATITPVSSVTLARIAEQAGAEQAVLLDSGYSTSLIYGSRVVAVGHSTRKVPSRPVPHAIVFMNPVVALVQARKP